MEISASLITVTFTTIDCLQILVLRQIRRGFIAEIVRKRTD